MGLFRDNESNNLNGINITRLLIPTGRRRTNWLSYERGEGFEFGTKKNKSSKRRSGRDWPRGLPITIPALQPLIHFLLSTNLHENTLLLVGSECSLRCHPCPPLSSDVFFFMICLRRCLPISSEAQLGLPSKLVKAALPVTMFDF